MKPISFAICFFALFLSCNSDDDLQVPQQEEANFYALTVGNSWVYKNYKRSNPSQLYEDTGVIDSISIVGTEVLNGNTYFKFRRWTTGNENHITLCNPNGEYYDLLRDSIGYLINDSGIIQFANNDFSERELASNSWGTIHEKLVEGETTMNVEAGEFNCINSERYGRSLEGVQLAGLDRFYYSDGIGLIHDTSSFTSSETPSIKRYLDSYIIN